MNKSELNRKIQLLEQANEELEKINYKLRNTECVECNKIRETKNKNSRRRYVELMSLLNGLNRGGKY